MTDYRCVPCSFDSFELGTLAHALAHDLFRQCSLAEVGEVAAYGKAVADGDGPAQRRTFPRAVRVMMVSEHYWAGEALCGINTPLLNEFENVAARNVLRLYLSMDEDTQPLTLE
jgi:hypothetical protein